MKPFTSLHSLVVPVNRSNVDTDALIPKQYIKMVERTGFGRYLFDEWRYLDKGYPGIEEHARQKNPEFSLNQARYKGAKILIAQDNFGCGSSREHAVWALDDYGIRAIVAPSFAEIFYANCFKNGVLPISLPADLVNQIMVKALEREGYSLTIDLPQQLILEDNAQHHFDIDPYYKSRLIQGLDDIDITLGNVDRIEAYEMARRKLEPWLF
ncbi:MAG: 3-isopropylmalate dehydratase small subunit [Gammaproteobacteria bacterium]|uniref:3-isopropylmalate dehydratase small subunit n=1 Tax=Limnobacter sp. TaxID=2003368 RepID=UPI001D891B8B|nr:3-isopropylmalate dehydratase small subunit [Gammaproteobacteria bacterium]MBU0848375.1 3-isopropylmalate dehydratase small subunit [Gammaproteobacteria bacterium]MBU1268222.1 3-isopropylmalate dehydratase small subunit [Gammaproteobacteria bacterium]MBU1529254.1 3-isopropylmalate dehydratase small subunit [Gammaproteobacteria bacterium]MBU1780416.1 3-isopropylmalate dehydratase small subunit [Gammaproteobacteria bacterium]